MLPDTILQSDLLDILFENRNKAYGAYALRKSYNKTIITATSITLIIATVFSLIQYMHYNKHHELVRTYIIPPDAEFTRFKDPEPMKPITPKPQRTHVPANEVIYSAPVISNNNDETKIPAINDLANNIIGDQNIKGTGEVDIVQPPAETREVDDNSEKIIEVKADDSPLAFAQIMPEYPGGIEALKKIHAEKFNTA